jgi:hypothetical protein|tara:strand:+ start:4214 stop:4375 length:162 start_codon:yes stop_codon:yes gene_type:complete
MRKEIDAESKAIWAELEQERSFNWWYDYLSAKWDEIVKRMGDDIQRGEYDGDR